MRDCIRSRSAALFPLPALFLFFNAIFQLKPNPPRAPENAPCAFWLNLLTCRSVLNQAGARRKEVPVCYGFIQNSTMG